MKKFISFCKLHLSKSQFVILLLLIACVGCSFAFDSVIFGIVSALLLFFFLLSTIMKTSFCVPTEIEEQLPESAEKLPYVYYDKPAEQKAHTIRYYSPYLGKMMEIRFLSRNNRGKPFDNVRGIKVTDRLVLLRAILFVSHFPDDIRVMSKQYEGDLPNEAEIKQIYAKFNEINQNLYECGESLLQRREYLYTSGNEDEDEKMNYCLNFANGEKSLAECDSFVCAVLIERLPLDTKNLSADFKAFQNEHPNQSELDDEFDVLCLVRGKQVRFPFSKRYMGEVIGIFPSKHSPLYLELNEVEGKKHTDEDVDKNRLLDEKYFCEGVAAVKDRMNLYLQELGVPILDGIYLADSPRMQGCGWLVGFEKGNKHISSDYYGGNQPAKLRYMGCFEGRCQK